MARKSLRTLLGIGLVSAACMLPQNTQADSTSWSMRVLSRKAASEGNLKGALILDVTADEIDRDNERKEREKDREAMLEAAKQSRTTVNINTQNSKDQDQNVEPKTGSFTFKEWKDADNDGKASYNEFVQRQKSYNIDTEPIRVCSWIEGKKGDSYKRIVIGPKGKRDFFSTKLKHDITLYGGTDGSQWNSWLKGFDGLGDYVIKDYVNGKLVSSHTFEVTGDSQVQARTQTKTREKSREYARMLSDKDEVMSFTEDALFCKNRAVGEYKVRKKVILEGKIDGEDTQVAEVGKYTLFNNAQYGKYAVEKAEVPKVAKSDSTK